MLKSLPLIAFAAVLFAGPAQADAQDAQAKQQPSTLALMKETPKPKPGVAPAETTASTAAKKAEQNEPQNPDPGYLNGGYFGQ